MTDTIIKPERVTQNKVCALFENELGYEYLGDWSDETDNSNIEESYLRDWLKARGKSADLISSAIQTLRNEAIQRPDRSLYENNKAVYSLLRYGIDIVPAPGRAAVKVHLIDWDNPGNNHFAIAEEVTLAKGDNDRRPDIVIYVNGIALGVLELKKSTIDVNEGIRQNLSNQDPKFQPWFFSTIQYVFAGNETQGLRYGTIETANKFFLSWKEDPKNTSRGLLYKYLLKMCEKERFLEVIRDFVLFDHGKKKLPRPHQYFAIKNAQAHVRAGKGGIIWHSQGTGKSIVMVFLAKWLTEHDPDARILVVTDREELDDQIENRVFKPVGVDIHRATSSLDLLTKISATVPPIICTLIHKFGNHGEMEFEHWIKTLQESRVAVHGNFYVFVDEAHRSHKKDGKFHRAPEIVNGFEPASFSN